MHNLQARLKANKPECCLIRLTIRTPLIIFAWMRECIWASLCLTALNKRLETGRGWEQGELMFCCTSAPQDITTISAWAVKVHSAQVSQGSEHWGVSEPELCFTVTITLPQDVLEGGGGERALGSIWAERRNPNALTRCSSWWICALDYELLPPALSSWRHFVTPGRWEVTSQDDGKPPNAPNSNRVLCILVSRLHKKGFFF